MVGYRVNISVARTHPYIKSSSGIPFLLHRRNSKM